MSEGIDKSNNVREISASTRNDLKEIKKYERVIEKFDRQINNMINKSKPIKLIDRVFDAALTDKLTGVCNSIKFEFDFAEAMLDCKNMYAFVYINVENFKMINDVFGYDKGNETLKIIANSIKQNIFEKEYFTRYTDDKFCILLKYTNDKEIENRLSFIITKIKHDFSLKVSKHYDFVIFAGIYVMKQGFEFFNEIYTKASYALKDVNKNKGDIIAIYDNEIKTKLIKENEYKSKMRYAAENKDFKLYLQPKYDLKTEKIVGAEALVRWVDSKSNNKIIYPNEFIYVFEQNGFISEFDLYMFNQACETIKNWINNDISPVPISINFSKLDLANKNFAKSIYNIAKKHNVPTKYLEVELTESIMMYDQNDVISIVNELHQYGMRVSMDDFGSGYSSLGILRNLPFDVIKFDKTFLDDTGNYDKGLVIISSMISMAKNLGMTTVAEGIETIEHINLLKKLNCDIVQGYYYSKPMPVNEFTKLF